MSGAEALDAALDMAEEHLECGTLSPAHLGAARRELIAARREVERLREEGAEARQALGGLLSGLGFGSGQPEVPITAASAEEWMRRWRERAEKAEAERDALRKRLEEAPRLAKCDRCGGDVDPVTLECPGGLDCGAPGHPGRWYRLVPEAAP